MRWALLIAALAAARGWAPHPRIATGPAPRPRAPVNLAPRPRGAPRPAVDFRLAETVALARVTDPAGLLNPGKLNPDYAGPTKGAIR